MLHALVINPWAADFKLYDEWMHPLGLYFLLSRLRQNGIECSFFNCLSRSETAKSKRFNTGDFECRLLPKPQLYELIPRHYKLYGRSEDDLRKFLTEYPRPDIVFMGSMMTYWAQGVLLTVAVVREIFPETPVVLGGIAATLMPGYFKAQIAGCSVFTGSLLTHETIEFPPLPPLHPFSTPFTYASILDLLPHPFHGPVMTSLGCPYRCTFCASQALQPFFVQRPVEIVLDEIQLFVNRFGVRDFAFYDDALLYMKDISIMPLLNRIIDLNLNVRFHAPNGLHAHYLTGDLLKAMKDSGFTTLRFGFESGAVAHRNDVSSKSSHGELKKRLQLVKDAGFDGGSVGVYVMAGLKDQAFDDVLREMEYVSSLGVRVQPVFLSPVPSTPLFDYWAEKFPKLQIDPLWQNDHFFVTQLPGWGIGQVELIRTTARQLNSGLVPPA